MDNKIRLAIVGFGNVGKYALDAVQMETDLELRGIVDPFYCGRPAAAPGVSIVDSVEGIKPVDVVLLCVPSMLVPEVAPYYLEQGISTVDGFDLHGQAVADLRQSLDKSAKLGGAVAITAAGWDPGLDSLIRAVFKLAIPRGITHTNFGPGMSLGHSVAARSVQGVKDAVALTYPVGSGKHRRLVYAVPETGADLEQVEAAIKGNPYFTKDETVIIPVEDLSCVRDHGHGAGIERKGISGQTHNQRIACDVVINNPAVTSQVMTLAARAARRCDPGAYTLLDIPLRRFFAATDEELVKELI